MEVTNHGTHWSVSSGNDVVILDPGYMILNEGMLKRYCDNARAYGWECGVRDLRGTDIPHVVNSSQYNPFVKPDWDAHLNNDEVGFQLAARDVPL